MRIRKSKLIIKIPYFGIKLIFCNILRLKYIMLRLEVAKHLHSLNLT